MKESPTPRDPEWYLRMSEQPGAARRYMAEVLARVETRRHEREIRRKRGFIRRLFAR